MKQVKLKTLIIGVVIMTFCLTMLINLWSASRINSEVLIENALENNRVYAQKLATTAERYIEETYTTLKFSANYVAQSMDDENVLSTEAERLRTQNKMFNSVFVTDKNGLVLGVSPPSLELLGETMTTLGPLEAMNKKEPMISKPYEGMTGRLVIFISHPIFSAAGEYLGLIGGSIYIKEDNVFHSLLGQHYYDDGSYVFVVDAEGRIIYHEDAARLNDIVKDNKVVQKVMNGEEGSAEVINTQGVEMLAGYSTIEYANWGVISQRPKEATLAPVMDLTKNLMLIALPLLAVALLAVLYFASKIAKPLSQLTVITGRSKDHQTVEELNQVAAWYFEANALKVRLIETIAALHGQVSFFKTQSATDPLTGLTNRRTMDEMLARWMKESVPYAVLLIDLDRFKSVNDTYGHGIGDEVLKYLAVKMEEHAPSTAVSCRYGGEEFVMLLPNASVEHALEVAENLRQDLEETISPCGRPVTMSGGIALFPQMESTSEAVIELADTALYQAKQEGRNRICVAGSKVLQEQL